MSRMYKADELFSIVLFNTNNNRDEKYNPVSEKELLHQQKFSQGKVKWARMSIFKTISIDERFNSILLRKDTQAAQV